MRKLMLVAGAAILLSGCGEKGDFEKAINAKIGHVSDIASHWGITIPVSPSVLPNLDLTRLVQGRIR